jgi:predicted transposase/invertase (TIGR01784 family)
VIKRLLRHKADFGVVSGFLTTLLGRPVTILRVLEGESNARAADDRTNRVDVLAEDRDGARYIIEVQTTTEVDFFHRMAYGAAKALTETIKKGQKYGVIKKVFSVNIVYFAFGQGKDYVYRGTTEFRGVHTRDVLQLSKAQKEEFNVGEVSDIFPEYFVLRVNEFNDVAKTPLDEWIYFFKHSEIPEGFSAPGLEEAKERLAYDTMASDERRAYDTYIKNNLYDEGVYDHYKLEGLIEGREQGLAEGRTEGLAEGRTEGLAEGLAEGRDQERLRIARNLKAAGLSLRMVMDATGLPMDEIGGLGG